MNSPNKKKVRFNLVSHSLILSTLARASEFCYDKLPESAIGHLLTGNHRGNGDRLLEKASEKIAFRRRISIPFKRWMARKFEQSFLLTKLLAFIRRLPLLQLRCLGIFYFAFGLCTSVAFTIERFVLNHAETPLRTIMIGLISAMIGGILSTSAKSCGIALSESRIFSLLLFRLLGIKSTVLSPDGSPYGRGDVSFLLGLGMGLLGALTSPLAMMLAIPFLCLIGAIFLLPECGVVLIFLTLPFLSTVQVAFLTATVTAAWLCKLMRGKRTLATTAPDLAVFGFGLVTLFGGFVSLTPTESLQTALLQCCLICGFFITVNLIRTSAWVYRCIGALIASLSVTALIGVAEYLLGLAPLNWLDPSMLSILPGRAVSLFGNPNVLSEMLLLTTPFLAIGFLRSKLGDTRLGYVLLALLALICLIFTWSRGGWLSAILIGVVFLMLSSRHSLAVLAVVILCLPLVAAILPVEITTRFFSIFDMTDTSIAYRFGIYQGTNHLLEDCLMGGIGLGESAFRNIYPLYSLQAIEAAPHTHNLFSQLTVSLGLPGLLVFLAVLIIFLRHCFSYFASSHTDELPLRYTVVAGFSAICGFLFMGLFDYVFYNNRIFLLFWLILGLSSAAIRAAVRERITTSTDGPSLDLPLH